MAVYPILSDWDYVRTLAVRLYTNRDQFAYLYGGNGEYIKDEAAARAIVDRMWAAYPSHFQSSVIKTGHTKEQLIQHIIGKRVLDCSALVCYVSQGTAWGNLSVKHDLNSSGLISVCHDITTPSKGVCGGLLWRKGHVSIDVGGGCFVEAANEFVDIRMRNLSGAGFTKAGRLPWVNYGRMICASDR